jgi:TetR/AcrR family transcriptional repressor of nem operon
VVEQHAPRFQKQFSERGSCRLTINTDVLIDLQIAFLKTAEFRTGCLIGNFSIEAGDHSALIRKRLAEMFTEINESIVYCLKAAVDAGELSASTDIREVASFLYSSWHGAIPQSKVDLSIKPLERFKKVLFSQILH